MEIKNVLNSIINISEVPKSKLDKKTQTVESGDRDTQLGYGQEEASEHRMTEEQVQEVVDHLKNHEGIKNNNLTVRYMKQNDRFIVFIEEPQGKVVRRLSENEMWAISKTFEKTSQKGQILNKAV